MTIARPRPGARSFSIFPFLLAIYAPLRLAAHNVGEFSTWELLAVCGVVVLATATLYSLLVLAPFFRGRPANAALLTASIVAWILLAPAIEYAVVGALRSSSTLASIGRYRYAAAGSALGLAVVAVLLLISRDQLRIRRFATIFASALLSFGLMGLIQSRLASTSRTRSATPSSLPPLELGPASRSPNDPDIYVILLDQYANSRTLRRYLEYSNDDFEAQLRRFGFQIPSDVHSNYAWTALSLSSILNAAYDDDIAEAEGANSRDLAPLYLRIQSNRVVNSLKARGYQYYFLPSRDFPGTRISPGADSTIRVNEGSFVRRWVAETPFGSQFFSATSIGRILWRLGWPVRAPDYEMRAARAIAKIVAQPGPKLVFAHLMLTHDPFYFDSQCEQSRDFALAPAQSREAYLASLQCTNRLVTELVGSILSNSHRPVAIVLQGDHGSQTHLPNGERAVLTPDMIQERLGAFGAYLLPAGVPPIPDTVATINVFPLIFNRLFASKLRLSPDRSFFSTFSRPYAFVGLSGVTGSIGDKPQRPNHVTVRPLQE